MIEEEREEEVWSVTKVAYKSVPNCVPIRMATLYQALRYSAMNQQMGKFSHPA